MTDISCETFSIYRHTGGDYPTLPAPFQRENISTALDRCAKMLRISSSVAKTFRLMLSKTRPADFTDPRREPCCYVSQVELATELGLTPRQVRSHEKILCKLGLIEKRTMANGARSGWHGCGIFFSSAIALFPKLQQIIEKAEAERAQHGHLRGLRSIHLRHVKSALQELSETHNNHPDVRAIAVELDTWPDARKLHSLSLDALAAHESEARALALRVTTFLEKTQNISARAEENDRPLIQDTTEDSNMSCNASVLERTSGKPSDTDILGSGPTGPSRSKEKSIESGEVAHKNQILANLTPERLYNLSSSEMQMMLAAQGRRPDELSPHDFDCAAYSLLRDFGINESAYTDACRTMGQQLTTICLVITYAKASGPDATVRRPGGYLRGLTDAHRKGELNIMGSLIGLSMAEAARPFGA